jgi:4-hydroxy-tetrahydrodipicolinate reductase
MKIALIGYGKMGKAIERLAVKSGHEVVLKINSENRSTFTVADLKDADVAIEFSKPDQVYKNIMIAFEADIPVVCGTTGWSTELEEIEKYCEVNSKTLFYASNYSIGVNLFYVINMRLAELMNSQPQYDEVLLHESHHTAKLDSPSGTAIALAKQILADVKRLTHWVNYKADESIDLRGDSEGELPIFSTREDDVVGTHIVKYFSDNDEIEIIHKAMNRDGFALGALQAAEWVKGKKGVFGMNDLLKL